METRVDPLDLPPFSAGSIIRSTHNFRVVMGYKPGMEGQKTGERFFIEPLSDKAEKMLELAAAAHNVPNITNRPVHLDDQVQIRKSLRADFITENLPALIAGLTEIPTEGIDTIPSPDRMEECLRDHPNHYSFSD